MKILVIKPSSFGDIIHAFAAISDLKKTIHHLKSIGMSMNNIRKFLTGIATLTVCFRLIERGLEN